jgi:hypothetical protein
MGEKERIESRFEEGKIYERRLKSRMKTET